MAATLLAGMWPPSFDIALTESARRLENLVARVSEENRVPQSQVDRHVGRRLFRIAGLHALREVVYERRSDIRIVEAGNYVSQHTYSAESISSRRPEPRFSNALDRRLMWTRARPISMMCEATR